MAEARKTEVTETKVVEKEPETPSTPIVTKRTTLPIGAIIGIAAAVAVAVGISGFVAGMQYQKGHMSSTVANQRGLNGQFGPRGGNFSRNGTFGEVTAISDTSITLATRQRFNAANNSDTSTTKTYTINSSTIITVDGNTAKASDIKTGDTVMITASSSDSSVAAIIRDGMGGMMGPGGMQQSSDTSVDNSQVRTN